MGMPDVYWVVPDNMYASVFQQLLQPAGYGSRVDVSGVWGSGVLFKGRGHAYHVCVVLLDMAALRALS
jgi:hypothetical protein